MQNNHSFTRFSALIGNDAMEKVKNSHILIFGIGGVGSFAVEALARAGVGKLTIVDFDCIAVHNINRQIHALTSTVGKLKAEVMKERILDINPQCLVTIKAERVTPENVETFFDPIPDFVVDAIDDVPAKIGLILLCWQRGIPLISAMGTGNKLHPEQLQIADISKTEVCPLCRSVRRHLREQGIYRGVDVVFSKEIPVKSPLQENGRPVPASSPLVPPAAGILMASYIIDKIIH